MAELVLVTGGAGFVGSHTVDLLVKKGYKVRVLDNLDPQVHGPSRKLPSYWNNKAEFIYGDVRRRTDWIKALKGMDAVIHLAARVGVGQSMYQVRRYMAANTLGTSQLLDLAAEKKNMVRKIVVASSMSIYGEGAYSCKKCGPMSLKLRPYAQMKRHDWEMHCPKCAAQVYPLQTAESKPLQPTSVYAISKRDQEELCLTMGQAYNIPVVALRYFNIYGTRQALSNPYTGAVAIFSSRLMNNHPPLIFEDGRQSRDFIDVRDVARANVLALESSKAKGEAINIGTGVSTNLLTLCSLLSKKLKKNIPPAIPLQFRDGDIRHCFSDSQKAKKVLGFSASITLEDGMENLVDWLKTQKPADRVQKAAQELHLKGLLKS